MYWVELILHNSSEGRLRICWIPVRSYVFICFPKDWRRVEQVVSAVQRTAHVSLLQRCVTADRNHLGRSPFTWGNDLIVWVNTVFCGSFLSNHFHIHFKLHLTTGTVLFPLSSHAIPGKFRVPYRYRFGVEAVCNSFGACFEGPVVFSGGQQSKQVIGRMERLFKDAVCLLQAVGGEGVVLGR